MDSKCQPKDVIGLIKIMLVYDEPLTPFSLIAKINHKHRKEKR